MKTEPIKITVRVGGDGGHLTLAKEGCVEAAEALFDQMQQLIDARMLDRVTEFAVTFELHVDPKWKTCAVRRTD